MKNCLRGRFSSATGLALAAAFAAAGMGSSLAAQDYQFSGRVVSVGAGANKHFSVGDRFTGSFSTDLNAKVTFTGNNYRHYNSGASSFAINFANGKKFSATNSVFTLDASKALAVRDPNYRVLDVDFVMIKANPEFSSTFNLSGLQSIRSADFDKSSKNDLKLASVEAIFHNASGKYFKNSPPAMQKIDPSAFTINSIEMQWLDPSYSTVLQYGARYTKVELKVESFTRAGSSGGGQPANRAPSLSNPGNKSVTEGGNLSFTLSASDPDGDKLSYSMSGAPSGAMLVGNKFSYSPGSNVVTSGNNRKFTVRFTVSDGRGGSNSKSITLTVNDKNRAPSISSIPAKSVKEGSNLKFGISASDPDGDKLSYSLSGAPAGATISGNTFSYTPKQGTVTSGNSRSFNVQVTVKDNRGASASRTFSLRVDKASSTGGKDSGGGKTPDEGKDRPSNGFDSRVETSQLVIETQNDNNRDNGRQEGIPQGVDGNKNTKTLHWSPEAFYRLTPKQSGKLRTITFMTANDYPDRDPKTLRIDGVNGVVTANPPSARFKSYTFTLPNGGLDIVAGRTVFMSIEARGNEMLQFAEIDFEIVAAAANLGSVVQTNRFKIETANDNNRDNGRLEAVAQGVDGKSGTKVLHWADTAVYRITPKANGVLRAIKFVTANDEPSRDVASVQIDGVSKKLTANPPSGRFQKYSFNIPNNLKLKKGEPVVLTLSARGNGYLQFAELELDAQF